MTSKAWPWPVGWGAWSRHVHQLLLTRARLARRIARWSSRLCQRDHLLARRPEIDRDSPVSKCRHPCWRSCSASSSMRLCVHFVRCPCRCVRVTEHAMQPRTSHVPSRWAVETTTPLPAARTQQHHNYMREGRSVVVLKPGSAEHVVHGLVSACAQHTEQDFQEHQQGNKNCRPNRAACA